MKRPALLALLIAGEAGAATKYLACDCANNGDGTCDVKDGSTEIFDIDASAASNTPIPVGLVATAANGWAINCSAGARIIARGIFDTP